VGIAKALLYLLGLQANVWTEYIPTTQQVEYMVLPRLAALAEVLWTPARLKNRESFKVRMQPRYQRYAALGANYAKSAFNVRQQVAADTAWGGDVATMGLDATGPQVRYTLDGSAPTAYNGPFTLTRSAVIKAGAFENGQLVGKVTNSEITTHKAFLASARLAAAPSKSYPGAGPLTLGDGLKGSRSFTDGRWLGFWATDLVATLDLGRPTKISTLASTFLQRKGDGIFLPTSLEVAVPADGRRYHTVYSGPVGAAQPGTDISETKAEWPQTKARYVKVTAKAALAPAASGSPSQPEPGYLPTSWWCSKPPVATVSRPGLGANVSWRRCSGQSPD